MKTKIELVNAECYLYDNQLSETVEYYNKLAKEIEWQQRHIKIFGKECLEGRLTAWYGDKEYRYSGTINKPKPLPQILLKLKNEVEQITGKQYNTCLLNYYRDGKDSIGWHSDNEKEVGEIIASVSLGVTREFQFQEIATKKITKLNLQDGSILEMGAGVQSNYKHQVPKRKVDGGRINVTFRQTK